MKNFSTLQDMLGGNQITQSPSAVSKVSNKETFGKAFQSLEPPSPVILKRANSHAQIFPVVVKPDLEVIKEAPKIDFVAGKASYAQNGFKVK